MANSVVLFYFKDFAPKSYEIKLNVQYSLHLKTRHDVVLCSQPVCLSTDCVFSYLTVHDDDDDELLLNRVTVLYVVYVTLNTDVDHCRCLS